MKSFLDSKSLNNTKLNYLDLIFFRGFVQSLKLSPNLRKLTKEIKAALMKKNNKKALELEVKKLQSILAMVREPEDYQKITETEKET